MWLKLLNGTCSFSYMELLSCDRLIQNKMYMFLIKWSVDKASDCPWPLKPGLHREIIIHSHTHSYSASMCSNYILPKYTTGMWNGKTGIKLLTFWLEDDCSPPSAAPRTTGIHAGWLELCFRVMVVSGPGHTGCVSRVLQQNGPQLQCLYLLHFRYLFQIKSTPLTEGTHRHAPCVNRCVQATADQGPGCQSLHTHSVWTSV